MSSIYRFSMCVVAILLGLVAAGCGKPSAKDQPNPPSVPASESKPAATKAVPSPAKPEDVGKAETAEGLAELTAEDRSAAEKQRVCPVSGEALGTMGKPCKVTVVGRTVFLCCQGCEAELRKNPDKYLAKLPKGDL